MPALSIDHHEVRLWAAHVARGLAGVVFGIIVMSGPWPRVEQTAGAFVVYSLVDAALSFYGAKRVRASRGRPAFLGAVGVLDVAAAVLAIIFPVASPLRLIGGIRAVATGACDARWSRRHNVSDLITLGGVAAAMLGILVLAWPGPGLDALSWLLGLQVMVAGSLFVAGSLSELRRIETTVPAAV